MNMESHLYIQVTFLDSVIIFGMGKKHRKKRKVYPMRIVILVLLVLLCAEMIALLIQAVFSKEDNTETAVSADTETETERFSTPEPTPDLRIRHSYDYDNITMINGILYYEDENYTSELVIDVSAHQTWIDWDIAAWDGVGAAMVRVGYRGYESGEINEDEQFVQNMENTAAAGISTGVYFFTQAINEEEAVEEAEYVLEKIRDYDVEGPIAIDMELSSDHDRINGLTVNEKTAIVLAFARKIKEAGYTPMVYGSASWLTTDYHLEEIQQECEIWVANYDTDELPFEFAFNMWQYNPEGFVYGIDASVDLNIRMIPKD